MCEEQRSKTVESGMPDKADVLLLQNGTYQCKACVRSINAKADGEDHGFS